MALDLNVLQKDINYFKDLKEKPARLHGEDRTFTEVIAAMKDKSKLSPAERSLVEEWVKELEAKKDYFSDDIAKARLESLKRELTTGVANTTTLAPPTNNSGNDGTKELKDTLNTIDPTTLEKAVTLSEEIINKFPSDKKDTLRGVHGAIIFDILRNAGHNLIIQNGQIQIVPKPGTDTVNLQEKLQTLVNTNRLSLDTIKFGMLYSSPSFKTYSELKKTKDASGKEIIDPKASTQDFITYLSDLRNAGNKSGDIESILSSQQILAGVDMSRAIKGFQDLGQISTWIQNNPTALTQTTTMGVTIPSVTPSGVNSTAANIPSSGSASPTQNTPSNLLTGELTSGVTGGKVTGVLGDATKGLFGGIGDMFKLANGDPLAQAGIAVGLIYGIYKLFQKVGFFGSIGILLGAGAVNAFKDIEQRFAGSTRTTSPAPTPPVNPTPAVAPAAQPVAVTTSASANIPQETPSQKTASDLVRNDQRIKDRIEKQKLKTKNATLDEYVTFINKECSGKKMETFVSRQGANDDSISIFADSSNIHQSIALRDNFEPLIWKDIMRLYITGHSIPNSELSGAGYAKHKQNIEAFQKKDWTPDNTLMEALPKIYK